ncbi:amidohydrolase family protein [Kocuria rhizophila]|nr:amidohydrolase family protein [Kocuria rhizophila]
MRDVGIPGSRDHQRGGHRLDGIFKVDAAVRDGISRRSARPGHPPHHGRCGHRDRCGHGRDRRAGHNSTAGGIHSHIHSTSPDQIETALVSGITTMIGGGTGPSESSKATTITPASGTSTTRLRSFEEFPMNFGAARQGARLGHLAHGGADPAV